MDETPSNHGVQLTSESTKNDFNGNRNPMMCTAQDGHHVDYGIPLVFSKNNDFRTSTTRAHEYIPSVPQNFDCHINSSINPSLLHVDMGIQKERFKTTYSSEFKFKGSQDNPLMKLGKAPRHNDYGRTMEEKMVMDPPPPGKVKISEMKDTYRMQYYTPLKREVDAPVDVARCKISALGGDLQPPCRPEQNGFWKHLDIYLTTNKLNHPTFSPKQMEKAQEDIITFYSATGKWKGYDDAIVKTDGSKRVYDATVFKKENSWKFLSRAPKYVPNSGMQSSYRDSYKEQNASEVFPYINCKNNPVTFDVSMQKAGPWQNIPAPGMYTTDNNHIGTGWPVRAVVPIGNKQQIEHLPCTK